MMAEVFGRWLLAQKTRVDGVGDLAKAAAGDRGFPHDGDPDAASKRLNEQQADGDVHQAFEDAVSEWEST